MIAFGTTMTDPDAYRRYARPGIELAAEEGSELLAFAAVGAMGRGCNLLLEAAAAQDDLEALVLVQQDTEITDPDLCAKVRAALADPQVAAVGAAGATGVRSIAWWDGDVTAGDVRYRYTPHGGGELEAYAWGRTAHPPGDVDTLDGSLLVLSPWAVRNVRFDETLALGHGYDLDYCLQLREAGRRVRVADIAVVLHRPLELLDDPDVWAEGHIHVATKWGTALGAPDEDDEEGWKRRARRAEAEKEAARTVAYSGSSELEARLRPLRRELDVLEGTRSWHVTRPLRWAKRRLAERRDGAEPA